MTSPRRLTKLPSWLAGQAAQRAARLVGDALGEEGYRRTTTGMRAILWIGAGFVAVAGLNEYLLSSQTDRYFAWTIKLPLTAGVVKVMP